MALEQLEHEIHQLTLAKRKLFNKYFRHHESQLLQDVGTKATGPRGILNKKHNQMKTAAEEEAYGAVNMTPDKSVQYQVCLSDSEIEDTTWSIADTVRIVNQPEREIYGITSKEFSICLVELKAWWEAIGVQELWNTVEQRVIHFCYPKMHPVSHISESIHRIGFSDDFNTDISEQQHIGTVKEAYRCTNKVNYIQLMLKYNDRCTCLDYMKKTLTYLALQGWYDIHSAKVFNLQSAAVKQRNTGRAHLLRLHHCQKELFFRPVSQHVHHWRETHVRGLCRSIELTSLRNESVDYGIPNFRLLFHTHIKDDWGHEVSGLVLGYDQNVLIDNIFIKLQNGLLYYSQPFHCPTSVECLGLDCKVEYTDANQGITPESHNIWFQYTDIDLDNTFLGQVPSFPVLYFSWTPLNQIL